VIDEFITSGETKWNQQSGVVLLLPHGYEGQGPDHSSARIERWLTMCADEAFVVAQPSTPASYFHLLRQHSLGENHRPMVVFTPKSMLKRKEAASQPHDFTEGTFRPFISDDHADPEKVDTLLLCSGRITWDLMAERARREESERFAIARVEQLYPRPTDEIRAELERYPHLGAVRWVQDEPLNMGPWPHYQLNVWPELPGDVVVQAITRPALSSPSVGTAKRHAEESKALMAAAFAPAPDRVEHHY
jgi:multifunctional 2-oxoglutarate metabolism enzyme